MKAHNRFLTIFIVGTIVLCLYFLKSYNLNDLLNGIGDFSIIFTSIILDAVPFIILGAFVSAIIQIFISEEVIEKVIPKNTILGYVGAALVGLIFPVCECAIVPITRRLIRKGVPVGLGVTFMLSVPIVNPVVIMSTYYAFYDLKSMVMVRTVGGFVCSVIIGLIVNSLQGEKSCLLDIGIEMDNFCDCGCNSIIDGKSKIVTLFEHANRELLEIIRYLIFGAGLSSFFQVVADNGGFAFVFKNKILVIIFMMFIGFALALCSEADAFVGKSFLETYTYSGVASFLLIGPMLDLKNLIMLCGNFKKDFVVKLSVVTCSVVFLVSCLFMICGL